MASVMDKPIHLQHHHQQQQPQQQQQQQQQQQEQQQKPHEALKCPRCDSSNTKFCYYNNYSLSQPRHFCKACKRYWTRGGTLRNVPVGGGCRKNKRIKRPIITTVHNHVAATSSPAVNHQRNPNPNTNKNLDYNQEPLFYGLLTQTPNYFPGFDDHARVSNDQTRVVSGYDVVVQPGLVFSSSSGTGGSSVITNHGHNSSISFSNYMNSSMYGSSLDQQQRFVGFASYDGGSMVKYPKVEGTQNMMQWNGNNFHEQNKNDHIEGGGVSSDPSSILWEGGWLDPTNNIGSSVPSLI